MRLLIFAAIVSVTFGINLPIDQDEAVPPISEDAKFDASLIESLEEVPRDGGKEDQTEVKGIYLWVSNTDFEAFPIIHKPK